MKSKRLGMIVGFGLLLASALCLLAYGPESVARMIARARDELVSRVGLGGPSANEPTNGLTHSGPRESTGAIKFSLGELAPDFVLRDIDGNYFHLADRRNQRPVVLEFGSYT